MTFSFHPPLGGMVQSVGFQSQPDYTCIESCNFWPINVYDGRALIATRPPMDSLSTSGISTLDADSQINMLSQLNIPAALPLLAANGLLYRRNADATWTNVSGGGLTTGRPLFATPFFTKMLFANSGTPAVYDYATDTVASLSALAGDEPLDNRVCMTFQAAAWLGGAPDQPHVFQCCRQDDLTDWDYTETDDQAAWISTGDDRGLITQPLSAMYAFTKDQAVLGCEEEVWVLTGHPLQSGSFKRIASTTGVLGQNAICDTPRGVFFLSHDGLMTLDRNAFDNINVLQVSKSKIPDRLLDISYDILNPTVCMAYDSRWNCLFITVRGDNAQAWAYFLDTGGFTEMELPEYPNVMHSFETLVTKDASGVLFGGSGTSGLRRFDRTASEQITSRLIIGPVRQSRSPLDADIMSQVSTMFGAGTTDDDATVEMYTAGSAAAAANRATSRMAGYKYATTVGKIRANNRNWYPNLRGHAAALRIDQTESTGRVVYEDTYGQATKSGINSDADQTAPVVTPPDAPVGLYIPA